MERLVDDNADQIDNSMLYISVYCFELIKLEKK